MSRARKLTLLLSIPLLGFAALLFFLSQGLGNDPRLLPSALIDRPLPEFSLPDLQAPRRTMTGADLKGEIALLNVWATWCPSCYDEHDQLLALAANGVPIFGLNYKDERQAALDWLNRLGNPYRRIVEDADGQLGLDLGVYGAPETYLLDASGVVRYRHVGVVTEAVWNEDFLPRIELLRAGGKV